MELQLTGTNMEITPVVRRYANRKLDKLSRHLPNIMEAKVEISEENTKSPQQRYLVRVTASSSGAVFHGEERGEDLFMAIDRAVTVMIRQLEHHKGKMYEKGRSGPSVREESSEPAEDTSPPSRVVKTKRFAIKPMTLEEATDQMEALGHDFFLFFDADAGQLKLLYRRKDGNYGLIEPELV